MLRVVEVLVVARQGFLRTEVAVFQLLAYRRHGLSTIHTGVRCIIRERRHGRSDLYELAESNDQLCRQFRKPVASLCIRRPYSIYLQEDSDSTAGGLSLSTNFGVGQFWL